MLIHIDKDELLSVQKYIKSIDCEYDIECRKMKYPIEGNRGHVISALSRIYSGRRQNLIQSVLQLKIEQLREFKITKFLFLPYCIHKIEDNSYIFRYGEYIR